MAKNTNFVSHKKSKQKNQDGTPQLPLASALVEGEIAINFAENVETLSIKNESGNVVTFSSDNYYTEKKLGSAFTGTNSAVTVTDVIEENEEIVATALNDLNENKLDASAYTPTDLSDYYTKEEVDIRDLWVSGTSLNAVVLKNSSGTASGDFAVAEGRQTTASGEYSHAEGYGTVSSGQSSHAEGGGTIASGDYSHAEGQYTITNNQSEHASGKYNVSSSASTTFGDSGNTLFSVGNGTASDARHNAFEIRQNGDIYIVDKNGNDILLQDNLGGVGGSITVDQIIDSGTSASTNAVATHAVYEAIVDDELVWTNAYVAMSGIVGTHTANTDVHITSADRTRLNSITGAVGTMAYEDTTSYSSATQVNAALGNKTDTATTTSLNNVVTGHTADTTIHVTSTDKTNWNGAATNSHTHTNKSALDAITGNVGTMAYENANSYSSATQVNTALAGKSDTGHTHASSAITSMAGYSKPNVTSAIATTDTLNQAVGKLECALGGMKLEKITQAAYDALVTKDSNTLYIITD